MVERRGIDFYKVAIKRPAAHTSMAKPESKIIGQRNDDAGSETTPKHAEHHDRVRALQHMPVEEMDHHCPAL